MHEELHVHKPSCETFHLWKSSQKVAFSCKAGSQSRS